MNPFPNVTIRIIPLPVERDQYAIYPRIEIPLEINCSYTAPSPDAPISLDGFVLDVGIRQGMNSSFVGNLFIDPPYVRLYGTSNVRLRTFLDLDFYRLAQIEKLREGKDLSLYINGKCFAVMDQPQKTEKNQQNFQLNIRIHKSQWVEDILDKVGFKDVSLLEIPRLTQDENNTIAKCIDSAWKQYMMGEYDKVLGDCRKALEGISGVVKKQGFEKTIEQEGKKPRQVPDWEKYFDHKDMGDIFGTMFQKMSGFLAPGAHYGKSINKEDADLALMVTHSMVNFIMKKAPDLDET